MTHFPFGARVLSDSETETVPYIIKPKDASCPCISGIEDYELVVPVNYPFRPAQLDGLEKILGLVWRWYSPWHHAMDFTNAILGPVFLVHANAMYKKFAIVRFLACHQLQILWKWEAGASERKESPKVKIIVNSRCPKSDIRTNAPVLEISNQWIRTNSF